MRSIPSLCPVVRIGSPIEYFHSSVLERIDQPDVRYHIRFDVTDALLALLEQGEIDIVVSTRKTENKKVAMRSPDGRKFCPGFPQGFPN
jgi:DNA-binding transcriptional LysR family regulator